MQIEQVPMVESSATNIDWWGHCKPSVIADLAEQTTFRNRYY